MTWSELRASAVELLSAPDEYIRREAEALLARIDAAIAIAGQDRDQAGEDQQKAAEAPQ